MLLPRALVVLALGVVGAGVSHGRVGAQTPALPTVEQVLDKYVAAVGGRAAIEKVTSLTARGTIEVAAFGLTGTIQLMQKAPDKSLSIVDLAGVGQTREGFDGTTAWEENPQTGMRTKSGVELAEARRNATFPRELKMASLYAKMTVKGREAVGGRDAIEVEAVPAEGQPTRMFFDAVSGMLVRQIINRESAQGPLEVDVTFSDFREIDGVKRPFSIRQVTATFTATLQLTEVTHNVPVDDGVFRRRGTEEFSTDPGALVVGQTELRADVAELREGQVSLSARQDSLSAGQDRLAAGQERLGAGQASLSERQDSFSAKQDSLSAGQDRLSAGQDRLREEYQALRADVTELRTDVHELRRHMGVLHEDLIDRIKALALPVEDIQRQIRAGDAAVRADLGARLDVVEAALRLRRRPRRGH